MLKHFLWKLVWGIIPTRAIINERFLVDSLDYPLCSSRTENLEHLFIECPCSRIAWSLSPWPIRFDFLNISFVVDWVKLIIKPPPHLGIQKAEERNFTLFAAICCDLIWMKRNEAIRSSVALDPKALVDQIGQAYQTHRLAWSYKASSQSRIGNWSPPPPPCVKINFDVSIGKNWACAAVSANEIASVRWLLFRHCERPSNPFISRGPPRGSLSFLSLLNER